MQRDMWTDMGHAARARGTHAQGALPAALKSGAVGDIYGVHASRRIAPPTALVDRPAGEKSI